MRLPNKYGTVYKLQGKRYRPYVSKKYIGRNIYAVVGYYPTREEALTALALYNPDVHVQTLREVYSAWSSDYYPKLKQTYHYLAAWKVLEPLSDRPIDELKHDDLQLCMNRSGKNTPTLRNVKILLNQLYEYAYIREYIPITKREMVSHLNIGKSNPKKITRAIFTEAERTELFTHDDAVSSMTVVLICTGLRISELCDLEDSDVSYEKQCIFVRKSKTDAGVREIPIADVALPYIRKYMQKRTMKPEHYRYALKQRYNHLPHDTRHTFATLLTESGCDQRIIDSILGHVSGNNTALNVYTHITLEAKLKAVNCVSFL